MKNILIGLALVGSLIATAPSQAIVVDGSRISYACIIDGRVAYRGTTTAPGLSAARQQCASAGGQLII